MSGPGVPRAEVDADAATAALIAAYDQNGDGALNEAELASFPPLAASLTRYDQDRNGSASADEIAARLHKLYGASASLTGVQCRVTLSGQPLAGAEVTFRPPVELGESITTAQGTTDETGTASPSIAATELPERLRGAALMHPGLYHVEITHPQRSLPGRYNAASELGCEIDPSMRDGTKVAFDLRP